MAQDVEKGLEVADVYAAALYELAAQAGTVDDVGDELAELVRLVEHEPNLTAFLTSAAIDHEDRARSLEHMFRGRLSDTVLNTLEVMNGRGRLGLLPALLRAYVVRVETARGQVEVTVTSAIELSPTEKAEVERTAAALAGRQPVPTYVVKPDILGGLILQIGDHRLDGSVRRHLAVARERLLAQTLRATTDSD